MLCIIIEHNKNCEDRRGSYWSMPPVRLSVLAFPGLFLFPLWPSPAPSCVEAWEEAYGGSTPSALSAMRYTRAPGQGLNYRPLKNIKRQGGKPSSLWGRLFRVQTVLKKNVNSYAVRYYFMLLPLGFECYAERGDHSGHSASARTENSTLTPHNKSTTSSSQPDSGIFSWVVNFM